MTILDSPSSDTSFFSEQPRRGNPVTFLMQRTTDVPDAPTPELLTTSAPAISSEDSDVLIVSRIHPPTTAHPLDGGIEEGIGLNETNQVVPRITQVSDRWFVSNPVSDQGDSLSDGEISDDYIDVSSLLEDDGFVLVPEN